MFYRHQNLPRWERSLRVALGLLIAAIAAASMSVGDALLWGALAIATVIILTGFVGFCPACAMVGRRTVRRAS